MQMGFPFFEKEIDLYVDLIALDFPDMQTQTSIFSDFGTSMDFLWPIGMLSTQRIFIPFILTEPCSYVTSTVRIIV